MALSENGAPIPQDLPLRAGGGSASKEVENQIVGSFSPAIQSHLKKIYKSLTTSSTSPSANLSSLPLGSYDEFEAWFRTPAASALAPPIKHDLSYPISNYYISSSHNTYLSGNQLYGVASGDAYTNVLLRGCRCLEIDVWDGENDNSSASASDMDDLPASERKEPRHERHERHESRLEKANTALNRFTNRMYRVKDRAQRMRSPSRSPRREHGSSSTDHQPVSPRQSGSLEVAASQSLAELRTEPRVYHGYTLTKDIPFRVVCHAIRESAFKATDLPVIVSLEIHCCLEQQEVMVKIMQEVFQDHLVDIWHTDQPSVDKLPSPDQLRNKILIKVKWTPDANSGESNDPLDHLQSAETEGAEDHQQSGKRKKAAKVLQALSDLGVYTRAYSFKHFAQPEAKIPTHVFSLSEIKVEDIHRDPQHGPALFDHNRNFLMRVFPSGLRVNSSNVEPCFLWRQGAQMVALNWQKLDQGTMLNEGMFADEEGWVLKPEGFRGASVKHDEGTAPTVAPKRQLLDLDIELIAAQNLPVPTGKDASHLPKMKPFIKIQLHVDTHGPPGQGSSDASEKRANAISKYNAHLIRKESNESDVDEAGRRLKRKSGTARTADPDFGGELMEWKGIHDVVDELSFLRLKINDDHTIGKDSLIAWACIKLNRLRTGYRLVHLLDATGSPCQGVVLLRVSKTLRI